MAEYQKVRSTLELSRRIAFYLDLIEPQRYNSMNHTKTIRNVNDILQGRAKRTTTDLLEEMKQMGPGFTEQIENIGQEIQAYKQQEELLTLPYTRASQRQYAIRIYDFDPEFPLKIVDQALYDRAAKDGFPPNFFRKSYFDHVTLYCLPDDTDLNFSEFHGCTFAVCRIRNATFDGTRICDTIFHSCDIQYATFFKAVIAHTQYRDSSFKSVSFQWAELKDCHTVDCAMERVNFLNATLDGCTYGRIKPSQIKNLHTATITQGGATEEEVQAGRRSIIRALQEPEAPPPSKRSKPRKTEPGR